MERLESKFRLQRQTMGILAQLNETTGPSSDINPGSSGMAATGGNDVSSGASNSTSFNDSSLPRWNSSTPHALRHWRIPRRESLERTSSLDSRFLFKISFLNPNSLN